MKKSISFWAFTAAAVLFGLQVLPIPGFWLMLFGAPAWTVFLLHIGLIAMFAEAFVRHLPRYLILVPLAAYGGYYALYAYQTVDVHRKSAELKASNPGKVLDFQPENYSLVMKDARAFVTNHAIPVVYEENKNNPEGYLSERILTKAACDSIPRDTQSKIFKSGFHFENRLQRHLCVLRAPESLSHTEIRAQKNGDPQIRKHNWGITEVSTDLIVNGETKASYKTASIWRLPAFPWGYIGCTLISSTPAWKCGADFARKYTEIDSVPNSVDATRYDSPESVMLGIPKYTQAALANFSGYAKNDVEQARISKVSEEVQNDVFGIFRSILNGENLKPSFNMGYSLSKNPERLAPLAEATIERLEKISQTDRLYPNRSDTISALVAALTAMPDDAFAKVADRSFEYIQDDGWDKAPLLYIRAASAGDKTFPFYKSAFISDKRKGFLRIVPPLALCRLDHADDETIAEMKNRFLGQRDPEKEYKNSLLLALVKFHEEPFVRENLGQIEPRYQEWAQTVLDGKGSNATGPNNCMTPGWMTAYVTPAMKGSLHRTRVRQGSRLVDEWTTEAVN